MSMSLLLSRKKETNKQSSLLYTGGKFFLEFCHSKRQGRTSKVSIGRSPTLEGVSRDEDESFRSRICFLFLNFFFKKRYISPHRRHQIKQTGKKEKNKKRLDLWNPSSRSPLIPHLSSPTVQYIRTRFSFSFSSFFLFHLLHMYNAYIHTCWWWGLVPRRKEGRKERWWVLKQLQQRRRLVMEEAYLDSRKGNT